MFISPDTINLGWITYPQSFPDVEGWCFVTTGEGFGLAWWSRDRNWTRCIGFDVDASRICGWCPIPEFRNWDPEADPSMS